MNPFSSVDRAIAMPSACSRSVRLSAGSSAAYVSDDSSSELVAVTLLLTSCDITRINFSYAARSMRRASSVSSSMP